MVYISLIGVYQENRVLQIKFSKEDIKTYVRYLTNQLWKLIPMYEHNEEWKKQLDIVIIEIAGFGEIYPSPQFLKLLCKLEGLKTIQDLQFYQLRKTVFDSISLLQQMRYDENGGL